MPKSTAPHPKYKTTLYPARLSEDFIIGCGKQVICLIFIRLSSPNRIYSLFPHAGRKLSSFKPDKPFVLLPEYQLILLGDDDEFLAFCFAEKFLFISLYAGGIIFKKWKPLSFTTQFLDYLPTGILIF